MGPLVPMPFLDDLDEHFVAAAEDFLDGRLEAGPAAGRGTRGRGRRRRRRPRRTRRRRPIRCRRGGPRGAGRPIGLFGIVAALAEVLRLDVADVQEAVAAHAEIDKRRLDARLQVDHDSLVDVPYVIVLAGPFDVQLFEDSVLNDRDPAFFRLRRR